MTKGRSSFSFVVQDPQRAQAIINEWLNACGFKFVTKRGEQFYSRGDVWSGTGCFQWQIIGNTVTVWFWIPSLSGDVDIYNTMTSSDYRDVTNSLLEQLDLLSKAGQGMMNNGGNMNYQSNQNFNGQPMSNPSNDFRAASNKADGTAAIVALVLSILSFLLVVLDSKVVMGGLGYLLIFLLGARGMKSDKRHLAVLAMILGAVSLVLFIFKMIDLLK